MKNRKLLLIVSLVLALTMSLGGTLAYLTDTDSDVNVMTLGNVQIEQHEYERIPDNNGGYKTKTVTYNGESKQSYEVREFSQNEPLLPAVGTVTGYDTTVVYWTQLSDKAPGGQKTLNGLKNVRDKFVLVENKGNTDAYVRTFVALEVGNLDNAFEDNWIKLNHNETRWTVEAVGVVPINGNNYFVYAYTYKGNSDYHADGKVPAGEWTSNNLGQVYLSPDADNKEVQALDGNKNGTYDILVLSQAVQADGFEATAEKSAAQVALEAGFGEANAANIAEWFGDEDSTNAIPVGVATDDKLVEALESGKSVVLNDDIKIEPANMSNAYGTTGINVKNGQTIDGNGNTLDIKGAGGTWDSGINTTGGLIKDLTVTGSFRGIFINHNSTYSERVVLENVIIDGTTYTISCDQGMNQGLTATNSTFNGWTSYAATLGDAKFVNCNFGKGNGYAYCRPYAPTEFVGCEFEEDYTVDPRAAVTFENCTLNGVVITADNVDKLVTDTAKVTVK